MDPATSNDSGQRAVNHVYDLFGAPLSAEKHVPSGEHRVALGQYCNVSRIQVDGEFELDVTEQFVRQTRVKLAEVLKTGCY